MIVDSIILQILVHLFRIFAYVIAAGHRLSSRQLPSWQMVQALEYMNARGKSNQFSRAVHRFVPASRFIQLFKNLSV
jgi:hypothetical protein